MTDKFLVYGNPIAQSKSPKIHQMFAKQTQQNIEYDRQLATIENFKDSLNSFFADEAAKGCNVTAPFKEQAAQWVNQLSSGAKLAGAVNTIIRQSDGTFLGDTTDGPGIVQDLLRLNAVKKGARILLLGAGGAARGALQSLLALEPELLLVANRTTSKAELLASLIPQPNLQACGFDDLVDQNEPFDLIINSTSASLSGELPPIPDEVIANSGYVYDMSYSDKPTVFLKHAASLGVTKYSDGLGMLVGQAAESFYLWRGVRPEVEAVIEALRAEL
ncbi:shikimate dehydrogenase [Paraglaciecola aquimarina]|uniref:Shikimate dehydrogenase (NADP(+)) n=2 Tax=Paraglaciecola algarum TaxID=3050085 RepID=A0ABS9D2M5_9ALTE|nr:shikimate dehydrogenase [Paraglaciecola sp. G1-23]MCF2947174.1 shikimate dehydrogenase [Paraglaciecola sp. G1-23]